MSDIIHEKATEARRKNRLADAAEYYIGLAAYNLAVSNYQECRKYREAIAYALLAMSLDSRDENPQRVTGHKSLFEDTISQLITSSEENVIKGFGYEWNGDMCLMCGEYNDAETAYRDALEKFQPLSLETQLAWGAIPEYDVAYLAMREFYESQGLDYYDSHDINFAGRIEWKVDSINDIKS